MNFYETWSLLKRSHVTFKKVLHDNNRKWTIKKIVIFQKIIFQLDLVDLNMLKKV